MNYNIEVDFEVYKELTYRRKTESHQINDVLREMLKLPAKPLSAPEHLGNAWVAEGVVFPSGTELRANYKGKLYKALVNEEGKICVDGMPYPGASPAAKHITKVNVNGWKFWEARRPGEPGFTLIDQLRKSK